METEVQFTCIRCGSLICMTLRFAEHVGDVTIGVFCERCFEEYYVLYRDGIFQRIHYARTLTGQLQIAHVLALANGAQVVVCLALVRYTKHVVMWVRWLLNIRSSRTFLGERSL